MRLWSLRAPTPNVYILEREWSIVVPVQFTKSDPELLDYVLQFNELKVSLYW
jgi:hypothetical protein